MDIEGIAELPLHEGHVPPWLANYMKRLAKAILEVIVEEYSPSEVVRRLANPIWFQALNNAIGMDWDSSGATTVTTAILRQVTEEHPELGIIIAGGKGRLALKVPEELQRKAKLLNLSSKLVDELIKASRLAAKTDTVLLQDNYQLYHHVVIVSEKGDWTIIQQGMNVEKKLARRYHWKGPIESTIEPHTGIAGIKHKMITINLTSRNSLNARSTILDLARQDPRKTLREVLEAYRIVKGIRPLTAWIQSSTSSTRETIIKVYRPQLRPPRHLEPVLKQVYESQPRSIEELILIRGVGPMVIRSLALVSELIYGVEVSHDDPVTAPIDPFRYAYIVGGKDGVPFKFNPKLAEEVVRFLEEAVSRARLGDKEKLRILRRLRRLLAPPR